MSDRRKCTAPAPPAPDLFRRVVLWRVRNEEHVAALEWLGELFKSWLDESGQLGPQEGESFTVRGIRGAVADLEAVAVHLEDVATTLTDSALEWQDTVLSVGAQGWAAKVRKLAADVERRLGPAPEPGEGA